MFGSWDYNLYYLTSAAICLGDLSSKPGSLSISDCICNAGLYRSSSSTCASCPAGKIPNATQSDCVDVVGNFVFAFVAFILSVFVGFVYIFNGQYHRITFIRRERVVLKQLHNFQQINVQLDKLNASLQRDGKSEPYFSKRNRIVLFYVLCFISFFVSLAFFYFFQMISVFIDVLILFRGFSKCHFCHLSP